MKQQTKTPKKNLFQKFGWRKLLIWALLVALTSFILSRINPGLIVPALLVWNMALVIRRTYLNHNH